MVEIMSDVPTNAGKHVTSNVACVRCQQNTNNKMTKFVIMLCIFPRFVGPKVISNATTAVRSVSICVSDWPRTFDNLANHSLPITKRSRSKQLTELTADGLSIHQLQSIQWAIVCFRTHSTCLMWYNGSQYSERLFVSGYIRLVWQYEGRADGSIGGDPGLRLGMAGLEPCHWASQDSYMP